jgi:general stress protein 26
VVGGELYVLTGTSDAKVRQLRHDPRYEAHLPWKRGKHTGYVRFRGRVEFVKNREVVRAVADAAGFLECYWTGLDDPNLTVLRLGIEAAEVTPPGKQEWIHLTREDRARPGSMASRGRRPKKG